VEQAQAPRHGHRGRGGALALQAPNAAGARAAFGTTRMRDVPGGPKAGSAGISRRFRGNSQQNSKYRQGYTESGAVRASATTNDACARQKLAFTS